MSIVFTPLILGLVGNSAAIAPQRGVASLPFRSDAHVTSGHKVPFISGGAKFLSQFQNPTKANAATISTLARLRAKNGERSQSTLTGALSAIGEGRASRAPGERLLVVYDYWSEYAFLGELYAREMRDLLSHFGWGVDMVPVQNYTAGMIGSHRATVYLGVFYDTELPAAFKTDVMNATKPVCWTGYNLWKLAWTPSFNYDKTFETKFGFRFRGLDSGFTNVTYKNTILARQEQDAARMSVLNFSKVTVLARQQNQDGTNPPYILKSGNLYVVADNPLSSVLYSYVDGHDRTLAFSDVLHDITNSGIATNRRAYVRIEDVSASADPAKLRQIADILSAEGVPFVISTIPFYRDPLGYWNSGVGYETALNNAPAVLDAIKYMISKGGTIVMHGYTHQYNDVPNPRYGVSGDDWEFYRMALTPDGGYTPVAPVIEDSEAWVLGRLQAGRNILQACGLGNPKGWLTPHYLASATSYSVFAQQFEYSLCPESLFTIDAGGFIYMDALFAPYPTKDEYGTVRIPETLSYISPSEPNMSPTQVINRARDMRVVRDGWAGMYFHPFLDPTLLQTAVRGVKQQGFTFVNPTAAYGPIPR